MRKERIRHSEGYTVLYRPNHPSSWKSGYVYEHRFVMEEHLGRSLRADELVHHINEDRSDNRIENLEVMTKRKHQYIHLGRSGVTDERIEELLAEGWSYAQFIQVGVWEQRVSRIKREIRERQAAA